MAHTILLVQPGIKPETRTYSDYESVSLNGESIKSWERKNTSDWNEDHPPLLFFAPLRLLHTGEWVHGGRVQDIRGAPEEDQPQHPLHHLRHQPALWFHWSGLSIVGWLLLCDRRLDWSKVGIHSCCGKEYSSLREAIFDWSFTIHYSFNRWKL